MAKDDGEILFDVFDEFCVDAGAEALRQRQMKGRVTRPWHQLPISDRRKWREHSRAVLKAALAARAEKE